jgi:hypothetical protein
MTSGFAYWRNRYEHDIMINSRGCGKFVERFIIYSEASAASLHPLSHNGCFSL